MVSAIGCVKAWVQYLMKTETENLVTCFGPMRQSSQNFLVILASVSFWPLLIIELVARAVPAHLSIR